MKLLIYIYSLSSGGAERVTATLANYWAQKGWEVVIVTVTGEDHDFYDLNESIRRVALNLAVESCHFVQAMMNNLRRIWMLRRIMSQEQPDVAMAMMATANMTLAIAGYFTGVPTVGSERVHPTTFPLGRMWEAIRRWIYPLLSGLVAQTKESADWLRIHASAKQIVIIPNPVNYPLVAHPPFLQPSKIIGQLGGDHVLLAVGRFEEQKGYDLLLTIFAKIAKQHSTWSLVILGDGSLRNALLQQAADLGIVDRVALPGVVGNVGDWFEEADLYVMTSRFEGFPNTLLEALAYGVPAVAVDCETGPREILRHEVDGLLVPQDDPDALIAALDRIMSDTALRTRYAQRAVEVRERFSMEKIAGMWEELFMEITE